MGYIVFYLTPNLNPRFSAIMSRCSFDIGGFVLSLSYCRRLNGYYVSTEFKYSNKIKQFVSHLLLWLE